MRKITSLIGCLLLIISLSSISINAAERTEPRAESLSVVNSTLLIEGEYTHHGSVVVRDNGCLVIVGTFTVLQDYAYQYSIEVRNNGTLRVVEHGILKSNYPLLIKTENTAYIELNNGSVELSAGKLELTDSIVTIMNSKLNCTLLSGTSSTIDVVASTLSSSITELNKVLFSATNSVLTSCLNATDSACTLFNVTLPSAIATGTTAISIYRVLSIYVRDVIDVPVGGATVHIKHLLNDSVYQTGVTSHKGKFETYALSDIITATGEQFLGNYRVLAFYNGLTTTTAIALPHYQVYSKLEDVVNIKSAVLRFEVPLISSFYSAGRDIIIAENSTKILENSEYAKDGETYTYVQDGNILVKNNATLIIRKNTVLNIIQSSQRRYFISVEDQGRLIIEGNSSTVSNEHLNLYLFDNCTFNASERSYLKLNIIGSDNANIALKDTTLEGSVYAKCAVTRLENVVANASYLIFNTTTLALAGSQLASEKLEIATQTLDIRDCTFTQPLRLKYSGYLTNVTAPEIATEATIYKCWWLTVEVVNGHNLPVSDAEVRVYSYNNLTELFYTSARTDKYGIAKFKLLGSEITGEREEFVGNYKVVAFYTTQNQNTYTSTEAKLAMTDNKKVTLKFAEKLVPPYYITVMLEFISPAHPGAEITISGEVLYNDGPDKVANANVTIEIVETGFVVNTTTDSEGRYTCNVTVPLETGKYTVKVKVRETVFNMSAEISKPLVSELKKLEFNYWFIIGFVILAALSALGIRFLIMRVSAGKVVSSSETSGTHRTTALRWLLENAVRKRGEK